MAIVTNSIISLVNYDEDDDTTPTPSDAGSITPTPASAQILVPTHTGGEMCAPIFLEVLNDHTVIPLPDRGHSPQKVPVIWPEDRRMQPIQLSS
jgi:hypothetical protein